jgi:hypothetical protein
LAPYDHHLPSPISTVAYDLRTTRGVSVFDALSVGLLSVLVLVVIATFRDYGIVWDEEWQATYGKKLIDFYTSLFRDRSAFDYSNLYLYGGLFDMVAALAIRVSRFGEYFTRHLLGGLVGVVGLAGTWQLARQLGGPRAGFLALLLLTLTPSYYGDIFNNPKDIPFACVTVWTLLAICRAIHELPRLRPGTVFAVGTLLGLGLGTRIGAVLTGLYFALILLGHLAWVLHEQGPRVCRSHAMLLARALWPALILIYVVMAIFWPWSVLEPFNPIEALLTFSNFPWDGDVLLAGRNVSASELPFYYLPLYLAVKLPELMLLALGLSAAFAIRRMVRPMLDRQPMDRTHRLGRVRALELGLVGLAALFPIAYFMVARPVAYNGIRHFLFILPPLAVFAGMGLDQAWTALDWYSSRIRRIAALSLGAVVAVQIWLMVLLHPYEFIYYNILTGGVPGAAGRFELDYWGSSLAEAARGLARITGREPLVAGQVPGYTVMLCGYPLSVTRFLPPSFDITEEKAQAHFYVSLTNMHCDDLTAGDVIYRVERFGVPLSVVKDRRGLVSRQPYE